MIVAALREYDADDFYDDDDNLMCNDDDDDDNDDATTRILRLSCLLPVVSG